MGGVKINIEIIHHAQHRYPTVGDWWVGPEGTLEIRVSKLKDPRHEALIAIHELTEVLIETVKRLGKLDVPPAEFVAEADKFDETYEENRAEGDDESEPGCETTAPYYQGHMAASAIENIAAMLLGVNYNTYADEIASMP